MIPLFTTDYSIGKSILKFRPNNDHEDGPDSVLQIAKEHGLKHIFLVEDRMHGFLDYLRYSQSANFHFSFGLRCKIQENIEESNNHKIIIFAKDDEGIKKLYKIYSFIFCERNGVCLLEDLKSFWSNEHLMLAIPFYDSYIHSNNFSFSNFIPDFSFAEPLVYFVEQNDLPVDHLLKSKVIQEAKETNSSVELVKSIYYKNRKDFTAYQVRKIIDSRSSGKSATIDKPNLEGCSSDSFSFESWLEYERNFKKSN